MSITLLDGGMGQELIARAGGVATPLWSTQALLDRPDLVGEVHRSYADAGATMATTNTYAIHRDRLRGSDNNHYAAAGVELPNLEPEFANLLNAAAQQAQTVRDRSKVAGSIGPLGASYRPDLQPDSEITVPLYAEICEILAPSVDVLLFETVPSVKAAEACLEAGRQTDRPVWLSFNVIDENGGVLRSGEALNDAMIIASHADAVLINCAIPEAIPAALEELAKANVPFGAYANGFTKISQAFMDGGATASEALQARTDLSPEIYADHALSWVNAGATIIGGCCEVGPAHIKAVADRLTAEGHVIQ